MTRRFYFVWCGVLAFALAAAGQDLNKVVTFRSNAKTADVLLAEFGKQVGLTITVSDEVRPDVLAVRFECVTLDEALKHIAATLDAEWTSRGTAYHLNRTKKQTYEARAEDFKRRVDGFRRTLESLDPAAVGGPLTARLLQSLSPADLAAIEPGERRFWLHYPPPREPRPTAMEKCFRDYASEWPVKYAGYEPNKTLPRASFIPTPVGGFFVARRPAGGEGVSVRAVAANKCDVRLTDHTFWIAPTRGPRPQAGVLPAPEGEETPIVLSPEAKEALALFSESCGLRKPVVGGDTAELPAVAQVTPSTGFAVAAAEPLGEGHLSAKAQERLSNPESYEPLGMFASEALMAAADARKVNMVAVLPDSMLAPCAALLAAGPATPSQLLAAAGGWDLSVDEKNGWLTILPVLFARSWDERVDRRALGKVLRVLASNGHVPLDDLAAYALNSPPGSYRGAIDAVDFTLICSSEAHAILASLYGPQRDMLLFWGALGPRAKDALASGNRLVFRELPERAQQALRSLLFNSEDGPTIGYPDNKAPLDIMYLPYGTGIERTVRLKEPCLASGTVEMAMWKTPAVLASGSAGAGSRVFSLGELPTTGSAGVGVSADLSGQGPYTRYAPGTATVLRFHFSANLHVEQYWVGQDAKAIEQMVKVADEVTGPFMAEMDWTLQDAEFRSDQAAESYSGLPADFKRAVEQARRGGGAQVN